jgi:hypothetical protein
MFAAVCMDGSYAQKVYFAKLHERPKPVIRRPNAFLQMQPAFRTFVQHAPFSSVPVDQAAGFATV